MTVEAYLVVSDDEEEARRRTGDREVFPTVELVTDARAVQVRRLGGSVAARLAAVLTRPCGGQCSLAPAFWVGDAAANDSSLA